MKESYLMSKRIKNEAFISLMKDYATYLVNNKIVESNEALKEKLSAVASPMLEQGAIPSTCIDRLVKIIDVTSITEKLNEVEIRKQRFLNNLFRCGPSTVSLEGLSPEESDLVSRIQKKEAALEKLKYEYLQLYHKEYTSYAAKLLEDYKNLFDESYLKSAQLILN